MYLDTVRDQQGHGKLDREDKGVGGEVRPDMHIESR